MSYKDIVDKTVVAAGWGLLTESGDEPKFLHRTDLQVIDIKACSRSLNDFDLSDDILNHFCTVGKFKAISLACVRYMYHLIFIVLHCDYAEILLNIRVTVVGQFLSMATN